MAERRTRAQRYVPQNGSGSSGNGRTGHSENAEQRQTDRTEYRSADRTQARTQPRAAGRPSSSGDKGPGRGAGTRTYSRRPSRAVTTGSNSRSYALTRKEEQKQLVEYRKEKEWQESVERTKTGIDKVLVIVLVALVTIGALMVYSASYPYALSKFGDSFYYLKKHIVFLGVGFVFMLVATFIPISFFKKYKIPVAVYIVAIIALLAVFAFGTSEGEAKRWIYIGSVSVQPSEIMKLALIWVLAYYVDKYQAFIDSDLGKMQNYKYNVLFPMLFVGAACALVLAEKHLSGTIILAVIGVAVIFVGCRKPLQLALTAGGAMLAAGVFYIIRTPYALQRLTTFGSSEVDTLNEGWQTYQGVVAIGSGGLFGVGLSESRQKYSYVSQAQNDFIFTIWCEEVGFVGAVLLIALFLVFIWRGYRIALRAPDRFSSLMAFGITTQIGLQAFLNMMVVCDIIPNTGISLPFISYGGSSIIMLLIEAGFLLSISRQSFRKKEE